VAEGKFPKPFKLGPNTTVWDLEQVEAAIECLKSKRVTK
jgi:predicted DNA-binding transcriptional regulator AlpA